MKSASVCFGVLGAYSDNAKGGAQTNAGFEFVKGDVKISRKKGGKSFLEPIWNSMFPSESDLLDGRELKIPKGECLDCVFSNLERE